jgi:murein DD-endopeptidase MepM/ murein hydrolase activator NlpD
MAKVCALLVSILVVLIGAALPGSAGGRFHVDASTMQAPAASGDPHPAGGNARDIRLARPVCAQPHVAFGYRVDPFTGRTAFHAGIDLGKQFQLPVRAAANGRVTTAERRGPYGLMIEMDHGHGYRTRYSQLASLQTTAGALVSRGEIIGAVGASGRATGPHLHFEIWFNDVVRDPMKYLDRERTCE